MRLVVAVILMGILMLYYLLKGKKGLMEMRRRNQGSEYQEEVKQKNQLFLRQHSPCAG